MRCIATLSELQAEISFINVPSRSNTTARRYYLLVASSGPGLTMTVPFIPPVSCTTQT